MFIKTFKDLLGDDFKEDLTSESLESAVIKKLNGILDEKNKLKSTLDNSLSEVASWKKKYNETLSEEEQKRIAQEEFINSLKQERDALKREKDFSNHKAKFLSLGYDEELAKSSAEALLNNDFDAVFNLQKEFLQLQADKIKREAMQNNPTPKESTAKAKTARDYKNASYEELAELYETNKELFNKL